MTTIDLPDGRLLDVRVSGPADGVPLVFHHGTPGSNVPSRGMQRDAHERGLRLVTYSRPGYGDSTRNPGRSVADVVPDVVAILDALDAPRCLVVGKSGGGPHALATAAGLPARVAGVCSIAGVGPWGASGLDFLAGMGQQNVEEFTLALEGEAALRPFLEREAGQIRGADAPSLIAALDTLVPDVDRAVLTDEYGEDMIAAFAEALRTGVDGWLDDDLAFSKPWGFDFAAISVPTFIWQGDADLMVPYAHGRWLASGIPQAVAHLEDGAGHLSISAGPAGGRIIDELAGTL